MQVDISMLKITWKLLPLKMGRAPHLSKIENSSYYQELVSHPLPEYVDDLCSSVRKKQLQ